MKLYFKYCVMAFQGQMEYKRSFFMATIGQLIASFSMFLSIYFMFERFNHVRGFTYQEVLLCFAVVLTSFSLAECFFRGFDLFSQVISNGEFDRMMVRPANVMVQVLGSRFEFSRVGRLIQAIIVFIYAIPANDIAWTGLKIGTLCTMIVGGTCLFGGLFIIYASFCFFTIEGLEFMNIFTDGGRELGRYPLAIYGERVLKFFTFIIPLAAIQYYPFLYLIGRMQNPFYALSPLVGVVFLIPCYVFWRFGIAHYKSTGS